MEEGVSTLDRRARPWAVLVGVALLMALGGLLVWRATGWAGDDDRSAGAVEAERRADPGGDGDTEGAGSPAGSEPTQPEPSQPTGTGTPTITPVPAPPPSTTSTVPALPPDTELLGSSAADAGPDPNLLLGERANLDLVLAGPGEWVEWDLDTLAVTRHEIPAAGQGGATGGGATDDDETGDGAAGDGATAVRPTATGTRTTPARLFIAPGRVLLWPGRDGALLSVVPGRARSPETVATGVLDVQAGWSTGTVVVRTADGVGELGLDGHYTWGPAEPPDEIDGRLLGAADGRAYLFGERLRTWGAADGALDAPAEIGLGGRPLAFGPYGPVWLASNGTLNVPLGGEDLSLPAGSAEAGRRWVVQGAAVSPTGRVAVTLQEDGTHPSSLVIIDGDGSVHREARVRAELLRERAGHEPLTRLRWSADGRWLLLADETYRTLVAYRPDRGRAVVLPESPLADASDAVLVRVTR